MKRLLPLFCSFALISPLQAEKPKLVVAILVDQFRYDYLERFHDQFRGGRSPRLTDHGAFMTFARYDYCPTVTGPGHASFLSGSTPAIHGIIGNDWFDKSTGQLMYCCKDAWSPVSAPRLWRAKCRRNFIGSTLADQMRLHFQSKVVGISLKDRGAIFPAGKKPSGAYWLNPEAATSSPAPITRTTLPEWVEKFNSSERAKALSAQKWDRLLQPAAYERQNPAEEAGKPARASFPYSLNSGPRPDTNSLSPLLSETNCSPNSPEPLLKEKNSARKTT